MDFQNKKIAILGLGIENKPLAKWLIKHGAEITICDKNSDLSRDIQGVKDWRLGENYLDNLADFEIIFRTPGISYLNPKIQAAEKAGVKISSQTKLFFDLCSAKIIGITGTKGKGTTASIVAEILKKAGRKTYLVGNIGKSAFEIIDEIKPDDLVVMELSSFQLQDAEKSPQIAVMLDIFEEHLNYHQDFKEYFESKTNLVRFQNKNDYAVISADFLNAFEIAAAAPSQVFWFSSKKSVDRGTFVSHGDLVFRDLDASLEQKICATSEVPLLGKHNLSNIAAAITCGKILKIENNLIKAAIVNFKGLPHRIQFIKKINGVKYYDDSYSTNPYATLAALNSFENQIILLAGGSDKNLNYHELAKEIIGKKVKVILFGENARKISKYILDINSIYEMIFTKNLQEAFEKAKKIASSNQIVLLSPASASFDQFKNATERGDIFQKLVESL